MLLNKKSRVNRAAIALSFSLMAAPLAISQAADVGALPHSTLSVAASQQQIQQAFSPSERPF